MMNEEQKRFCKYCGAEITQSTKICKNCGSIISKEQGSKILDYLNSDVGSGTKLFSKMTKCKTCGADIAKTANACPHCGAKTQNQIVHDAACGCLVAPFFIVAIIIIPTIFGGISLLK